MGWWREVVEEVGCAIHGRIYRRRSLCLSCTSYAWVSSKLNMAMAGCEAWVKWSDSVVAACIDLGDNYLY